MRTSIASRRSSRCCRICSAALRSPGSRARSSTGSGRSWLTGHAPARTAASRCVLPSTRRTGSLRSRRVTSRVACRAMTREFLFTSESVTEGHPDKIADQISDSVLDAVLRDDPRGRVAWWRLLSTGLVVVAGEISTETYVDIPKLVREPISDIGYTH